MDPPWVGDGWTTCSLEALGRYFLSQPDSLSHFAIATLPSPVFSHVEMDRVSLLSISLFMQVQYLEMIPTSTLALALSLTQRATHLASSGPARAGTERATPARIASEPRTSFIDLVSTCGEASDDAWQVPQRQL